MPLPDRRNAAAAAALLAAVSISACASHPKPPPTPPTVVPPPAPAPAYAPPPPAEPYMAPQPGGPAPGSVQDFVIHAGDRVYFDYDQYQVRADGRPTLDAEAAWLRRYSAVMVRVEGNTDERGTVEYNFALGARRAAAVKDYLVSHGVAPSRIATVSYGKAHPIALGQTEDDYAKNRNVHADITAGAQP